MRWAAVAASLTAVFSLAAAASSLAAPQIPNSLRHVELPSMVYLRAHAGASHGYELQLTAFHTDVPAQNGEPATTSSYLALQLAKAGASAEYSTREPRFDIDGSVAADLGARGRVDTRFVPRRVHREPVPWCEGEYTIETGLLVGKVSFHGEGGYATVRSEAVPATLTRRPKMRCHFSAPAKPGKSHESSRDFRQHWPTRATARRHRLRAPSTWDAHYLRQQLGASRRGLREPLGDGGRAAQRPGYRSRG